MLCCSVFCLLYTDFSEIDNEQKITRVREIAIDILKTRAILYNYVMRKFSFFLHTFIYGFSNSIVNIYTNNIAQYNGDDILLYIVVYL